MRNLNLILSFAGFCGLALHLILTVPTFFGLLFRERLTELSVFASPMRDFGGGPLAVLDFLSPFEQVAAAAIWAVPIWLFNITLRSPHRPDD